MTDTKETQAFKNLANIIETIRHTKHSTRKELLKYGTRLGECFDDYVSELEIHKTCSEAKEEQYFKIRDRVVCTEPLQEVKRGEVYTVERIDGKLVKFVETGADYFHWRFKPIEIDPFRMEQVEASRDPNHVSKTNEDKNCVSKNTKNDTQTNSPADALSACTDTTASLKQQVEPCDDMERGALMPNVIYADEIPTRDGNINVWADRQNEFNIKYVRADKKQVGIEQVRIELYDLARLEEWDYHTFIDSIDGVLGYLLEQGYLPIEKQLKEN